MLSVGTDDDLVIVNPKTGDLRVTARDDGLSVVADYNGRWDVLGGLIECHGELELDQESVD